MTSLVQYRGKRRKLRFLTYDLEWIPHTLEVRLVGVYDGNQYRRYPNATEFLRHELSSRNRNATFFAHAGGLADVQFILEAFIKRDNPGYELEGHWSGSSLVICTIKQGKNRWSFVDSYWLLRDSLAKIGDSLGMAKGGSDYYCPNYPDCGHPTSGQQHKPTCIFYAPLPILADYNSLDCRILYAAIKRFESEVWELGGQLKLTIASTAMMLFRCAFLRRDIPIDRRINAITREAYIASRVEVIQRKCQAANYYDINSSFPYSMTKPQPGRVLGSYPVYREGERLALIEATVHVPDMYVPPVPVRVGTRVYFPTGTFRRWFVGEDLELVLDAGGSIRKVHDVIRFEGFSDMADYVHSVYELRRQSTDPFKRIVYKYLLNSLYGKFGEGEDKSGLLVHPRKPPPPESVVRVYRAGVYQVKKDVELTHNHVPIAANITASSRGNLTRHMWDAVSKGDEIYYLDTDSLTTTATLDTSDRLGDLKLEYTIDKGTFLAPKLYCIHPGPKIRAKGFRSLSLAEFESLANGDPVTIERMIRVRENFASGHIEPRERDYQKRTLSHMRPAELVDRGISPKLAIRPKREIESDGNSRPWDYDELLESFGKSD